VQEFAGVIVASRSKGQAIRVFDLAGLAIRVGPIAHPTKSKNFFILTNETTFCVRKKKGQATTSSGNCLTRTNQSPIQ